MPSIKVIEDITNAFVRGNISEAINILKKEAMESKRKNRKVVGNRIDNLIKSIPYTNYASASVFNQGNMDYSKKIIINNPGLISEYTSIVTPEQVVLDPATKNYISMFFREWEVSDRLSKFNISPTNKILLYGPPGTGKTLLAHAIANQLNFPLVLVRLDELISSYLGKTGQNIRDVFEIAKERNVVLFLDEIDTIAKYRADEKELGELKRIVTVLLQNIDFFPNNSIIIGATNHEDILDKAIWRRFPLKIKLELPNTKSRELLFSLFLDKIKHDIDLGLAVSLTEGLSGSEIFDLTQQAIKNFIISKKEKLTTVEILISYFQLMYGKRLLGKESNKKNLYKMCKKLNSAGYSLKDIETISNIPYTTLRDNIK